MTENKIKAPQQLVTLIWHKNVTIEMRKRKRKSSLNALQKFTHTTGKTFIAKVVKKKRISHLMFNKYFQQTLECRISNKEGIVL